MKGKALLLIATMLWPCVVLAEFGEINLGEMKKDAARMPPVNSVPVAASFQTVSYSSDDSEKMLACGEATHIPASYHYCLSASPYVSVDVILACGEATSIPASFKGCLRAGISGMSADRIQVCGKITRIPRSFFACLFQ